MSKDNELLVVARQNGLEVSDVESILALFGPAYQDAKAIAVEVADLQVTSEDQKAEMSQAREARLKLKNIRVEVEKTRKSLKEKSLREGKAIDGMANIIKAVIVPYEERLEAAEKFAERAEAARKEARYQERVKRLSPYANTSYYDLYEMPDEGFETLFINLKDEHERREAEAAKAEAERQAREADEAAARASIEAENARLRKEAEEREKTEATERAAKDAELAEERRKREEAEEEARRVRQLDLDKKEAEAEAARKLAVAPDKEKIADLAAKIFNLELPEVSSPEAQVIVDKAGSYLDELSEKLINAAKEL